MCFDPCTRVFAQLRTQIGEREVAGDTACGEYEHESHPAHLHGAAACREDFEGHNGDRQQGRDEDCYQTVALKPASESCTSSRGGVAGEQLFSTAAGDFVEND